MREKYGTWGNEGERREERRKACDQEVEAVKDQHRIRAMQVQHQGYARLCRTQVRGSASTGLEAVQHSHLCP